LNIITTLVRWVICQFCHGSVIRPQLRVDASMR
jgi:hypothetical protein